MFFGPIFQLQWSGVLCPCFEKDEDRAARQSLLCLHHRRVRWHPTGTTTNQGGGVSGVTSLVVGLFKKTTSSNSSNSNLKNAILAKLLVVDDATNGPTLQITPITANNNNSLSVDSLEQQGDMEQPPRAASAASFMKCIPLKQVKQVQAEGNEGSTILLLDAKNQTLVRLDVLKKNSSSATDDQTSPQQSLASATERTEVMDALSILLNWVSQHCGSSNTDDDDTQVRNRAQQVAHFAKREIELQQKKREREKRKAGYLEQSKGLKYTALAMANREESR